MSLFITSLNSGSNGNCYYVGNNSEAILVDAGLSCKETEKRMHELGLSVKLVRAIFVSHEHSDHIKGISVLAKKYHLPVYITSRTLISGGIMISDELVLPFNAHQPVTIGSLHITAFPKTHDAAEPHSFTVRCNDITVGVFTDIGRPCDQLIHHFKLCNAAFLEANYDEVMLEQGNYPYHLKQRIRGGRGHLSNAQALDVFIKHRPSFMSHLLLSHLSRDNNSPELLMQLFEPHAGSTHVSIASRYKPTDIFTISDPLKPVAPSLSTARLFQGALF